MEWADTSVSSLPFTKTDSPKITGLKGPKAYIFPKNRNAPLRPNAPVQPPLLAGFTQSLAQSLCQPSRTCISPGASAD